MIIPIGHESDTVRRIPWVTVAIMAICLIVHIAVSKQADKLDEEIELAARKYLEYYFTRPYLELDPEIKELLYQGRGEDVLEPLLDMFQTSAPVEDVREMEQEKLDQLAQRLKEKLNDYPFKKWGFIPAKKTFTGLLTHMFLHGDWLHLLGNLFFLYLTGPFIEDVWGRPIYIVFYLLVGMLAAVMFSAHYPQFNGPLIGASGAIAGVMGAFLIRYWNTRIKFFYIFSVLIRGTFHAPAWLMLPLWLLLEILNAKTADAINPQGGGVAYWAHVWGFAFGALTGIGMKMAKIEEKYVHPKIESQTFYVNENLQIHEDAMQLRLEGKMDEAFNLLVEGVQNDPNYLENVEALWEMSRQMGREQEAGRYLIRLIENEIRNNQFDAAVDHYRKLKAEIPAPHIGTQSKIMLMEYLGQRTELGEARELADELLQTIGLSSPPGLLLSFASAAMNVSLPIARSAVDLCLQHPDIPEGKKESLRAEIVELQKNSDVAPPNPYASPPANPGDMEYSALSIESHRVTGETDPVGKPFSPADSAQTIPAPGMASPALQEDEDGRHPELTVLNSIPTGIQGENIRLEVEERGQKILPLDHVKLISVVKITPSGERAFLLIDLILDDPASGHQKIRIIRLSSRTFSAKRFVKSAPNPLEAFRIFVSALMKRSGARPYPDLESIQLKRLHSFIDIENYEASFLQINSSQLILER